MANKMSSKNPLVKIISVPLLLILLASCSGKEADQVKKIATQLPNNTSSSCLPNENKACVTDFGFGNQVCDANGASFGACEISSCIPGFYLENNICIENVCAPDSTTACPISNGVGEKTCNVSGSGFGQCQIISCDSGFEPIDGTCLVSTVNSPTPPSPPPPIVEICSPGTVMNCSELNGTGIKTCNEQGSGYGACQLADCSAGYYLYLGVCVHPPADHEKDCENNAEKHNRQFQIDHHGIIHVPQWIRECENHDD